MKFQSNIYIKLYSYNKSAILRAHISLKENATFEVPIVMNMKMPVL